MAVISTDKPAPQQLNERLFGGEDYVPYVPSNTGVIPDDLGFWPRGVRADTAGVLEVWWIQSDAARTLNVAAGEIVLGPIVRIGENTTATVHLIR